jgi:hypothetical protein
MAQKPKVFINTADPASSSAATISTYYASSHSEQIRLLSQTCLGIAITEDAAAADLIVRRKARHGSKLRGLVISRNSR